MMEEVNHNSIDDDYPSSGEISKSDEWVMVDSKYIIDIVPYIIDIGPKHQSSSYWALFIARYMS